MLGPVEYLIKFNMQTGGLIWAVGAQSAVSGTTCADAVTTRVYSGQPHYGPPSDGKVF
jgi:hypothetical protein